VSGGRGGLEKIRDLRKLGREIGIEELLRNFVFLGIPNPMNEGAGDRRQETGAGAGAGDRSKENILLALLRIFGQILDHQRQQVHNAAEFFPFLP
jgi:hypothetical protein